MFRFFGLTDKYVERIYEQFFILKHYGGWSFLEAYNLPIGLRNWFFERLMKHKEQEIESLEQGQSSSTSL